MTRNRRHLQSYGASFCLGTRMALTDRANFTSMLFIFGALLLIFSSVFNIMPINELGRSDISRHHLLWHFAIVEIVVISMQGNHRIFGRMIAEGQLTMLIQRPGNMTLLLISRMLGNMTVNGVALILFALAVIPLFTGSLPTVSAGHVPFLLISMLLGIINYIFIGHMIGMLEVLGPYSQPTSFIVSKFVFVFGGLFFPVIFYPEFIQKIAIFTPFPAIISVPGHFALNPDVTAIAHGLLLQVFWLIVLSSLALLAERRMLHVILTRGD